MFSLMLLVLVISIFDIMYDQLLLGSNFKCLCTKCKGRLSSNEEQINKTLIIYLHWQKVITLDVCTAFHYILGKTVHNIFTVLLKS